MKCGDIVRNHWAGEENPTKYFIFIKNSGKMTKVIHFDGKRLKTGNYYSYSLKEPGKYEVVGHIDLIGFLINPLIELLAKDEV